MDVRVGGVRFDALQVGVRVLWEIKTHRFDTYNAFIRRMTILVVGVSTQEHRDALLERDFTLNIVVTGCKR